MSEVTADMIERGRERGTAPPGPRRRLSHQVRDAREKLTSSGSGQRAFDVELLRVFATRHQVAAPAIWIVALAVGAGASWWLPATTVLLWLAPVCGAAAALTVPVKRFLGAKDAAAHLLTWQRRFAVGSALQGAAWGALALPLRHTTDPLAESFVLFTLLLVASSTAIMAATVPVAVYAGLVPLGVAAVAFSLPIGPHTLPALALTSGLLMFLLVLARLLYHTAVGTLSVQAEKDALIVELEQSKLNSDEARRRAEEASLAKSRFLATMSHELRTPLNAILGFSEVMKGELFGPHANPTYREYSEDIHSSGQHLLMLINEILDLSRVEAGRYDLREESMALAHVVEDCRHLLTLRASKRDIRLIDKIEPALPRIWADERALRQIVLNLLSNAIKFTPQGGTVTVKVGRTEKGGQYVSIRDTGPGIPENEIPIIMSSFGRGTLAQKNAEEGSGLGLPIVKGLIELHGGTFTLTSKVREGTEVVMLLPPERVIAALPPMRDNETTSPRTRRRGGQSVPTAA